MAPDLIGKLVAEHDRAKRGRNRLPPGRYVFQHVLEQFGQVKHLHAMVPQCLGENVMLLLSPGRPRQAREKQPPGMAGGYPFQLGSRARVPQITGNRVLQKG